MRIVSNESIFNLPGQKKKAHGGTAIFARNFSNYATRHGHEWIGVIDRISKGRKTYITKADVDGQRSFYNLFFPAWRHRMIIDAEKSLDAKKHFAEEITRLKKFFDETKPDIVFLNGFLSTAWMMLIAAYEAGIPIAVQHAGILQVEMETQKRIRPKAARLIYLEMERDIARYATKQVFLNDYSRQVYNSKVIAIPHGKSVIIPLPYQQEMLSYFREHGQQEKEHGFDIGNVARWNRIKNYEAFVDVAKAAHAQGLDWRFHCVTSIPQTNFKKRVKEQYGRHVYVHAPMGREDLAHFYAAMDAMILPSRFDVSPTVVMEATLAGKPTLISPNVGWVSEYEGCGMKDWVIDFGDPKKVVARLKKLLDKPRPKTFRNYIIKKHAPEKVFAKYISLFKQLTTI